MAWSIWSKLFGGSAQNLDSRRSIIIVGGGGTMGSSGALHLVRRGYTNIQILDVFPIPSGNSAGNDLNKIVGGGGREDDEISKLYPEILNGWKTDPVFAPYFHQTGRVTGATSEAEIAHLRKSYDDAVGHGLGDSHEWLPTEADFVRRAPHLAGTHIEGWQGMWSCEAGWAAAVDAIDSVGRELRRMDVKMAFGPSGTFQEPILDDSGRICIGVKTADGSTYYGDRVVMATGAWSPSLIDLEGQCVSKCWVIGHLKLTSEEAKRYKGIPVVYHPTYGFFFEPRGDSNIMKLCNEFPGYTRKVQHIPFGSSAPQEISVPRSHAVHPTDTMPDEGLDEIKRLVSILLPDFVGRELIDCKMCWCTDLPDGQWLFCEDPRWKGMYLATGDSGKSFHTIPFVGSVIADMLEGKMTPAQEKAWAWRPGRGDPGGIGRGGPAPKDIKDMPGWLHGDSGEEI